MKTEPDVFEVRKMLSLFGSILKASFPNDAFKNLPRANKMYSDFVAIRILWIVPILATGKNSAELISSTTDNNKKGSRRVIVKSYLFYLNGLFVQSERHGTL